MATFSLCSQEAFPHVWVPLSSSCWIRALLISHPNVITSKSPVSKQSYCRGGLQHTNSEGHKPVFNEHQHSHHHHHQATTITAITTTTILTTTITITTT
jgi:hypothetical protein